MKTFLLASFLVVSSWAYGADGQSTSPESIVGNFYTTLNSNTPASPLDEQLKALSGFLSQELNRLIASAQQAEAAYLNKYPTDKGILGNGTCFFFGGGDCSFTSYRITETRQANDTATVKVQLALTDCRPGYPVSSWENVVALQKEKEKWVINDIGYFGSSAARNLKVAIEEARRAVQQ
jgi:hypothetical protein